MCWKPNCNHYKNTYEYKKYENKSKHVILNQMVREKKRASFAWVQYYESCTEEMEQALNLVQPMREQINNTELPTFLIQQFKDLIEKYKHKYECSICMEDLSKETLQVVKCGHFFHKDCIRSWLNNNNTCPLCRKVIK